MRARRQIWSQGHIVYSTRTRRQFHWQGHIHSPKTRSHFQTQEYNSKTRRPQSVQTTQSTLDRRQLSLLKGITQGIMTFTCVPMLLALLQQASSQTKEFEVWSC